MKRIKVLLMLSLTIIFCCACGSETNGVAKEADLPELVTVIDEYFYVDSIGQAKHALILQNNSSKTVKVDNNVTVKDATDKIIGARSGDLNAIASGAEACVVTEIYDVIGATKFDYFLTIEEDTYHEAITQDLSFEQSLVGEKVIVTCTNNGKEVVKNLNVVALFFRDGNFVYYGTNWITEIKPGSTVSTEVYARESIEKEMTYDDVKVYISGWR